jgi:hypothetical protein
MVVERDATLRCDESEQVQQGRPGEAHESGVICDRDKMALSGTESGWGRGDD